jgi:hypothetical protein
MGTGRGNKRTQHFGSMQHYINLDISHEDNKCNFNLKLWNIDFITDYIGMLKILKLRKRFDLVASLVRLPM